MKKSVILSRFLLLLLAIWLVFSVIRATYNISKLFTQDLRLFSLNNEQREGEVYGDISAMVKQIARTTNGEPILVTGNDGGLYFFLRYLLYPQKVYWVNNVSYKEEKGQPWKYVFYPYKSFQNKKRTHKIVQDPITGKHLGRLVRIK